MQPTPHLLTLTTTSPPNPQNLCSTLTGISRASVYEEIPWRNHPHPKEPKNYLALLQTELKGPLGTCDLKGDGEMKQYNLVGEKGVWNPKEIDGAAPQILTIGLLPQDVEAMHKWHVEEHLGIVSTLPGYRRTFRYETSVEGDGEGDEEEEKLFVVHEVENVDETFSEEAEKKGKTEWAREVMKSNRMLFARGWKLIDEVEY